MPLRASVTLTLGALLFCAMGVGCKKPKEAGVAAVFVGKGATCVRLVSGGVRCAGPGGGVNGAPGAGFREIPALREATSIALAETHGCAVVPDRLLCFGTPFRATIEKPAVFDRASLPADVVVAMDDSVCVRAAGHLRCFDADGHVGPELMSTTLAPAAGGTSVCGIGDDGAARCFGELAGVTLAGITSLAVRAGRLCGITKDGSVVCASKAGTEPPRPVVADTLAFQGASLCVAHRNKTLSCEEQGVLRPQSGVFAVHSLSGAAGNACFVGQEQVAFCWGENARAELGFPEKGLREVPAALFFREAPP